MRVHFPFRRRVVAATAGVVLAAQVAPSAAVAEFAVNYANVDTRRWSCRLCEFDKAIGHAGTVSAGSIESTGGEMRFGRDNGIDRAGGYLDLNADYSLRNEAGTVLEFAGRNLGLASRDAALQVRKPRQYGVQIRHRGIPRNVSRDGRSPFVGTEMLSLPDHWIPGHTTAAMTQLSASSRSVPMATERSRSDIDAWLSLAPRITFRAGFFREGKRGIEQTFRDTFYRATALPHRIDYVLEGTDAGFYYETPTLAMAIVQASRRFENGQDSLTWQNPYLGGTSLGRSALAPDNRADTVSFVSRARFGRRTTLNATLVRSQARQHVPFLPPTTNESIPVRPIDAPGLAAERESLSAAINLVSRPTRRFRISLSQTITDRRDGRRSVAVTPVVGDLYVTSLIEASGYDYKRVKTNLSLRYRTPGRLRVSAGLRDLRTRRSNLEIAVNDERRGWMEVTGEIGRGWRLHARHARAQRDASEFIANTVNNPLTRRYYQAERDDKEWSGGISFDSTGLLIGLDANYRMHDYPDSPLGLQRDASKGWVLDVGHAPQGAVSLAGFYGRQARSSTTSGSAAFPTRNWRYDTEDAVTTAGARFRAQGFLHRAIELTVEYAYSNGMGDYSTALDDTLSSFPTLISRHQSVDGRLRYAWRPRTTLVLRYYFERFRAADWAIDGIEQDAIRNVLTFGRASPEYGNHLISVSVEATL